MTNIICTIGVNKDIDTLVNLINEGMNIARFNFSHGDFKEHAEKLKNLKEAEAITGKKVRLMGDTKGIEIRLGEFQSKILKKEDTVILTNNYEERNELFKVFPPLSFSILTNNQVKRKEAFLLPIPSLSSFIQEVKKGDLILLDDGKISLEVLVVNTVSTEIACRVLNDGQISHKKSVNIPGVHLSVPYVSDYDREVLKWCYENNFDFVALSFCRTPEDVTDVVKVLEEGGIILSETKMRLIPKIEDQEGVTNFQAFLKNPLVSGIMVARGDLGVEIPQEEVPIIERRIINEVKRREGVFSIVATQMLDSMIDNPRPTRAEVNDVFTAVELGADCVMLSGETANGKYPVKAVKTMKAIIERAEDYCCLYPEI